jgi:hypothetical protein
MGHCPIKARSGSDGTSHASPERQRWDVSCKPGAAAMGRCPNTLGRHWSVITPLA